jgi:hypothetical protein
VLDSVELETRGVPTVTIATQWFVEAARIQASLVGVPDLRIVGMDYVGNQGQGHWMSDDERIAMLDAHWEDILAALTRGNDD